MTHYDGNEVAMRLLPAVAPLAVDADADVRGAALDTVDVCMVREQNRHHRAVSTAGHVLLRRVCI